MCEVAGNFLVKMLTELKGGDEKTVKHVYSMLWPYLGAAEGIKKPTG